MAKLLVVDDDPVMQMTMRSLLEPAGHVVAVAADGRKGLAKFQAESFDLLLLDIFMPGMDGLETMRLILKQRPDVPIIMTSGRSHTPESVAEPDYLAMATKLGAVSALPKPFKPAALLRMVADCLAAAERSAALSKPGRDAISNF
jgi:CheY-like chemotaxis protein